MENFELTAAVTTDVPVFYDPPAAEPDEFVLPDAREVEPVAEFASVETMTVAEETPAQNESVVYFQDVYGGFGFYAIDDGDPLVDDVMTGEWAFRRPDGTFGFASEWDGLLA